MADYRGMAYLRRKLACKRQRVGLRYRYYEMKNSVRELNLVIPAEFKAIGACLGWCGKAVDSLGDRLIFRTFRNDNFDLNTIYQMNNPDILFPSAVQSALIAACSFIYLDLGEDGFPRMQVIDGGNATGVLDDTTGLLIEGYAVLQRDDLGNPTREVYLREGETWYYDKGQRPRMEPNPAPYPLLVPILYRPDARRPFGHSRITRACMQIMQGALRTFKRSEVSAEFYSFPQKYVLGLSETAEQMDRWRATISSFLDFRSDPETGEKPSVGQFQQQSMSPYTEQLRTYAALFAGETGLTLDDLGFVTDNPSSAEAIKASHENLRLAARRAQGTFGSGFLNAGYLAACLRDNFAYQRRQLYLTKPVWEPVFEPDAATISAIGDGVGKINAAVPGYFGAGNLRDLTGVNAETTGGVTNAADV